MGKGYTHRRRKESVISSQSKANGAKRAIKTPRSKESQEETEELRDLFCWNNYNLTTWLLNASCFATNCIIFFF